MFFSQPTKISFHRETSGKPRFYNIFPARSYKTLRFLTQLTLDASVVLDKEKVDKDSLGLLELQSWEFIHKINHKRLSELKGLAVF